ncbi:MAG TPA: PQQ-dependent dehydrogenase, methanol/ethanol family [Rhizomicrobium sp.]|nr:PQQ-dependent dehydrogenase, methanol/ethanol family [Rhizomicrobium sp.]
MAVGRFALALGAALFASVACAHATDSDLPARLKSLAAIDSTAIDNPPAADWLSNGRDYREQRFSPLSQINTTNVARLGVAWEFRTWSTRALEASPIVANGVMYITAPWSEVFALDARTGREIWTYDPHVPGAWGRFACCDVPNRGVAIWKGAVFVGTLDGRLVKLDAGTGKPLWDVSTIDRNKAYTITGAPRVVRGLVLIGNGGAEYDVRGYLSAYDAETGKLRWRFYTVPGDPNQPPENAAMAAALKTWPGRDSKVPWWKMGGGGGPWDSMAYDPDLDLLYVGTGNGDPWSRSERSPNGGDNLYLSSILALRPETGQLIWYYQTTPGDSWDFDATSHLILADLAIDGRQRKVLIQAPKNGFFYVLDRATGKLISAKPYSVVTWAKGIDPTTGRPIENPAALYADRMAVVMPPETGGHNWQPMAFDPQTKLVYIPAMDGTALFVPQNPPRYRPRAWNTGNDFGAISAAVLAAIKSGKPPPPSLGYIKAWDPVAQKEVWHVPMAGSWNGGLLATAGGLVFGGGADGIFAAYDAATGAALWKIDLTTGILAPPVSYAVDGDQYIAVLAGWGGAGGLSGFKDPKSALSKYGTNQGRLFVFRLGGRQQVAALPREEGSLDQEPPPLTADAATVQKGFAAYHQTCLVCHGFYAQSEGVVPDLRIVPKSVWDNYDAIVLGGALADGGMASFKDVLSEADVAAIRAYVLSQAHAVWDAQHSGAKTKAQ